MNTEWMKRVKKFVLPAMGIVLFGLWILYIGLGFGFFKPWGGILGSQQPRRAECDLSFRNVSMEELEALEEEQRGGPAGLAAVAAWRTETGGPVRDGVTGKEVNAGVIRVYGPFDLAFPSRVLSGSLSQNMRPGDCVLTGALSWELFGSVDTQGCELRFGGASYRVAAVVDRKEKVIFFAALKGWAQRAAFAFRSGERIGEKLEAIGFGGR